MPHKIYTQARHLSLDVALGGVIGCIFWGKVLSVNLPTSILISLFACIWIVYTLDHLLDIIRNEYTISTPRHLFHQKYFKSLQLAIWFVVAIVSLNMYLLPNRTILYGLVLIGLIGCYLLANYSGKLHFKEIFSGIFYSSGVMLGPLSLYEYPLTLLELYMMIQFSLIVIGNLLLFSWLEYEKDVAHGFYSMTVQFGAKKISNLINILLLTTLISSIAGLFIHAIRLEQIIFFIMLLPLLLLKFNEAYFMLNERYRVIGDSIFFIPIIYLLK
ncbi:MAG TPA: hypothetical protein ACFCUD_02400 [Cyclobacteriaceae bacterium]